MLLTCSRSIDYRYFDAHLIEPLFEFGYGLSYTKFEYFGLQASFADDSAPEDAQWRAGKSTSKAHEVGSALQDWSVYSLSSSPIL